MDDPAILEPVASELTVPDPFQLEDPDDEPLSDDDISDERNSTPFGTSGQVAIAPEAVTDVPLQFELEQELNLAPQETTEFTPAPTAMKPQPPILPDNEPETEEDETPQLYLPGLVAPGLFLPIPNTDPLGTLLTKYIPDANQRPPRDISGSWKERDFRSLVMTNSWRALAQMARDRIVNSPATDLDHILELWYLRLSSLARLRFFNQTSSECTGLFNVLNNVEPPAARAHLFDNILPFELEIMYTRVRYWAGDHLGYLDALMPLLRKCKIYARRSTKEGNDAAAKMWIERGTRVSLVIASQLVEMKDFVAATRLLAPLCKQTDSSPALLSAIGRIYLQGGHLGAASEHFSLVEADPNADEITKDMNRAMENVAYGRWDSAVDALRRVIKADPDNALAANNLAVALLSIGSVAEGIKIMEKALNVSPLAVTSAEPWIFNLSTLYELYSTTTWEKKRSLLVNVAKWSGDGLKASCLKLPAV